MRTRLTGSLTKETPQHKMQKGTCIFRRNRQDIYGKEGSEWFRQMCSAYWENRQNGHILLF